MEDQTSTYSDKIGMPPGSLVYIGEERTQKVIISAMDFSAQLCAENILHNISDYSSWDDPDTVSILSVAGIHDASIIEAAWDHFGLDPLVLEDILNTQSRPKFEEFDSYVTILMKEQHLVAT